MLNIGYTLVRRRIVTNAIMEEKFYQSLVENSSDIIMKFDDSCRHVYVSPNIRDIVPISAEEFIGKRHRELGFDDKLAAYWEKAITSIITTGEPAEDEFRLKAKGGEKIFNWRLFPLFETDGRVSGVLSIARDITAHRKSEHDYRLLFETMMSGFALHEIITDESGKPVDYRFLSVNSQFETLTGLASDQVTGKRILEILPDTEDYWIETYGDVALNHSVRRFENFSRALEKYYEVVAYSPCHGQFVTLFQDITEKDGSNWSSKNRTKRSAGSTTTSTSSTASSPIRS